MATNSPDLTPTPVIDDDVDHAGEPSCDAFYRGRFQLLQPKAEGFRAGLDALLLAASLPPDRPGRAADLGAGAGAVGLAAACRCPALDVTLVENDRVMAELARRTLALGANRAIAPRLRIVQTDVLARRQDREAAGLLDGGYGTVLSNPPFHPPGGRASPHTLRQVARAMPDGDFLDAWVRACAALLEPRGLFAMIARPDNLAAILNAARNRLGDLRIVPVLPRADRRATRILVQARKGSRAGLSLLPALVLHAPDGSLTPMAVAIGEGAASVSFDLPG